MVVLLLATVLFGAVDAGAVETNVWTKADGGNWFETDGSGQYVNWKGTPTYLATNVALLALNNGATMTFGSLNPAIAGLVVRPTENAGESPVWTFQKSLDYSILVYPETTTGCVPVSVSGGTLSNGKKFSLGIASDMPRLRKEGDGTLALSAFWDVTYPRRTFEIVDGSVLAADEEALIALNVRVCDNGQLELSNSTSVAIGNLSVENGSRVRLDGNELALGMNGTQVLPEGVDGTGLVMAVTKNLIVTNLNPNLTYGARLGRLRLDSKTGYAVPFAKYDFETSLEADSSGHGRDLVDPVSGSSYVSRVYDETRGGYVARFAPTAKTGAQLQAVVESGSSLTGDANYTVSIWVKAAQTGDMKNSCPMIYSIGSMSADRRIVQFRYTDNKCTTMLIGHWNNAGDKAGLRAPSDPTAWHHFVVRREGHRINMWCDGESYLDSSNNALELILDSPVKFNLGFMPGWERYFTGDIDDVIIYDRALSDASVARLFAGEEPYVEGADAAQADDPVAVTADVKLETRHNGVIQLAGSPVVSNVLGGAIRGGLEMPSGGTLTMTGPGAFAAGIAGANSFVKTGTGRLVLSGPQSYTGSTTASAGTLQLQSDACRPLLYAAYDFELGIGVDSSSAGRDLTTISGVTLVDDSERGGKVARLPGTTDQKLSASFDSDELSGNCDYTISVWAKPTSGGNSQGTLVSFGTESNFKEVVFRYNNLANGSLVLSHWGGTLDFTNIPGVDNPAGAWHHYVATRKGSVYAVYCDGAMTWSVTNANATLDIQRTKNFEIGHQVNKTTRPFCGDLADVRVYSRALDATDVACLYAHGEPIAVARGSEPDAAAILPMPVMHYAFEDSTQLGKDSCGNAHLTSSGSGLSQIDSPIGGKALKFSANNGSILYSGTNPSVLPAGGKAFTLSFWVQLSQSDAWFLLQPTGGSWGRNFPTFVSWGKGGNIDFMDSYYYNANNGNWGLRTFQRAESNRDIQWRVSVVPGLREADSDLRWHHIATVYDPDNGIFNYLDGQYVASASLEKESNSSLRSDDAIFYLGCKPNLTNLVFRGALDEVKLFTNVLDSVQIRALIRSDVAAGMRILPSNSDVSVAAGAKVLANGVNETWRSLSGSGKLDVVSGVIRMTGSSTFNGTLAGAVGTVTLPSGASLTLSSAPTNFNGIFDMAGGSLTLPQDTPTLAATFRTTSIDGSKAISYPGDVEIPDGTALTIGDATATPCVTAAGTLTIMGGGSVTLADPNARGTWVLASGVSAVDAGAGNLSERWTVTNASNCHTASFSLTPSGEFVLTVRGGGAVILLK